VIQNEAYSENYLVSSSRPQHTPKTYTCSSVIIGGTPSYIRRPRLLTRSSSLKQRLPRMTTGTTRCEQSGWTQGLSGSSNVDRRDLTLVHLRLKHIRLRHPAPPPPPSLQIAAASALRCAAHGWLDRYCRHLQPVTLSCLLESDWVTKFNASPPDTVQVISEAESNLDRPPEMARRNAGGGKKEAGDNSMVWRRRRRLCRLISSVGGRLWHAAVASNNSWSNDARRGRAVSLFKWSTLSSNQSHVHFVSHFYVIHHTDHCAEVFQTQT